MASKSLMFIAYAYEEKLNKQTRITNTVIPVRSLMTLEDIRTLERELTRPHMDFVYLVSWHALGKSR